MLLQVPDRGQAVNRIASETADRLGDDQIDLSGERVGDHLIEPLAPAGRCSGYTFVGVYIHELPIIAGLNVFGVIVDLSLIAGELFIMIR